MTHFVERDTISPIRGTWHPVLDTKQDRTGRETLYSSNPSIGLPSLNASTLPSPPFVPRATTVAPWRHETANSELFGIWGRWLAEPEGVPSYIPGQTSIHGARHLTQTTAFAPHRRGQSTHEPLIADRFLRSSYTPTIHLLYTSYTEPAFS